MRLLALLCAFGLTLAPAQAAGPWGRDSSYNQAIASGGGPVTFTSCATSPTVGGVPGTLFTNYGQSANTSFTSVNGGTNFPAGAKVIVTFNIDLGDMGSTAPVIKVGGVGGTTMTLAVGSTTTAGIEILYADLSSSTVDTLTFVSPANGFKYETWLCGYLTNATSGAPSNIGSVGAGGCCGSPLSLAVTVPNLGIVAVGAGSPTAGTPPYTVTFANATQKSSSFFTSTEELGYLANAPSTATVTATQAVLSFISGMIYAAW